MLYVTNECVNNPLSL